MGFIRGTGRKFGPKEFLDDIPPGNLEELDDSDYITYVDEPRKSSREGKLDHHDLVIDILLIVGLFLAGIAIGMTIAYNVWTETPLELCREDLPRATCSVLFDEGAER